MRLLLAPPLLLCVAVLSGGEAHAQTATAVMQVSAQIVNTCHFGATDRCVLPGTQLMNGAPPASAVIAGAATGPRRVVHL